METKYKGREKHRLPLHIYLAYLLICTMVLTGVSFSSYISSVSGGDSARVAAFVVTAGPDANQSTDLSIDCGTNVLTQNYNFTVSNNQNGRVSEVAIKYDVTVKLGAPLPAGVSMMLDSKQGTVGADKITYIFADAGSFTAASAAANSHTLSFTADEATAEATDAPVSVTVSVHAEQID